MIEDIWPALLFVLVFVAWVLAKILHYARKNEQQWQQVDKSKLRVLEDDEE